MPQLHWIWYWLIGVWGWLSAHYIVAIVTAVGAVVMWLYGFKKHRLEVEELKHQKVERERQEDRNHVLNILDRELAFAGLNGQTLEQIASHELAAKWKLSKERIKEALESLENERPPLVHCFGKRWYLGSLPLGILS
jgi:hypothetical protein